MKDEVLDFIQRRFIKDNNWLDGNCLWFSIILEKRFPGGDIYYLPDVGHFVYEYNLKIYDWTGEVNYQGNKIKFSEIKEQDFSWYSRLMRDCFL